MKLLPVAVVLLALGGASSGEALEPTRASREGGNRCYAVRVEAVSAGTAESAHQRRFRRRFVAHELLDLELSVWLPARSEAALVQIHVYTPSGRLYEVLPARAAANASGPSARYRGRRSRVMRARLPVAGSHITSRSLYGTWRAEVFLDDSEEPCTRRATEFVIEP